METLDILYLIFSGLFGLVIGSFLNVVIYRLPNNMNIAFPASHCPSCGNQLKWYHNIPVLSYIFLGGKCAYCKKPISPIYMMVELLNCILWMLCYLKFGQNIFALFAMLFCSLMICVIYIDKEHMIIPDSINIAIAIVGILAIVFGNGQLNAVWWERLIGGFGMFLLTLGILALFRVILKKDAIGGGDIKFLGAVGLFLGWKLVLFGFFFAAIIACIIMCALIISKKFNRENPFPFGPYLAIGMIFSMLLGNSIINWYIGIFN